MFKYSLWNMNLDGKQLFRHCYVLHWVCRKLRTTLIGDKVLLSFVRSENMRLVEECLQNTDFSMAMQLKTKSEQKCWGSPETNTAGKLSATHMQSPANLLKVFQTVTKYCKVFARTRSRAKFVQSMSGITLQTLHVWKQQCCPTKHIFAYHISNEAHFCFKHLSECVSNCDNRSYATEPTIFLTHRISPT